MIGSQTTRARAGWAVAVCCLASIACIAEPAWSSTGSSFARIVSGAQPKMVKIYGAGGARGLEAYQSGFLVSEQGHVLTVWSYVLDTSFVVAVLDDGRRFEAELVGLDPQLEIAVLKIDAESLPHFRLNHQTEVLPGARVLAFSNLFNVATGSEPTSVLHGCVSAIANLDARRGAYTSTYQGQAFVLDVLTNNPGAAGGALTDRDGQLVGLLGKELRNSLDNTWLNYAVPISELRDSVARIVAGEPQPRTTTDLDRKPQDAMTLALLGLVLVPDVLANTPPFLDQIVPQSPAAEAGLRVNDMVLFVNDHLTRSAKELKQELTYVDRIDEVRLVVMRGDQVIEVSLFAPE